jgi:hypothetical protein
VAVHSANRMGITVFRLSVRKYLNNQLLECGILHKGPTCWQPRSPDLASLNLFFWGFVKDYVCRPPMPQFLPELQGQIASRFTHVTTAVLLCCAVQIISEIVIQTQ